MTLPDIPWCIFWWRNLLRSFFFSRNINIRLRFIFYRVWLISLFLSGIIWAFGNILFKEIAEYVYMLKIPTRIYTKIHCFECTYIVNINKYSRYVNFVLFNVCFFRKWLFYYGEQALTRIGFQQYVQNWNYTPLQNYQMDEFHSKVGFWLK